MWTRMDKEVADKRAQSVGWFYLNMPWLQIVEDHFDSVFRAPISFIFFYLGKDEYSKFTKVTTFVLLVLIPLLFIVLSSFSNFLLDLLDPAPPLVPANL